MGTYDPMPADGALGWGSWLRNAVKGLDARAPQNNIFNPAHEGPSGPPGAGSAAADDYSMNSLVNYISSSPSNDLDKVAYFPGGYDFIVGGVGSATFNWPNGVHMVCGNGSGGITGRPPQFLWNGTAGGTMFDCTSGSGGRVVETKIFHGVFREGTARPGKWWKLGDEGTALGGTLASPGGIDWGTEFYGCHFYNADQPAGNHGCLDFRFGPTNVRVVGCRFDNWTGKCVRIAVNNAASHVLIDYFTADNVSGGGEFLWLDNTGAGSNKWLNCAVTHGKVEVNSAPVGTKSVILLTRDHTSTSGVAHKLHVSDVTVQPGGSAGTDYAYVKVESTDASTTQYVYVKMDACQFTPGATGAARIIEGVLDQPNWGSFAGAIPDWKYTPRGFGFATPGGAGHLDDQQTQTRIRDLIVGLGNLSDLQIGSTGGRGIMRIHTALALPTGTPVGGGLLYVDAGALKYKGTSGTVTTIAPA